ncbi:MAG: hypothetical protein WAW06_00725 [bacterium]
MRKVARARALSAATVLAAAMALHAAAAQGAGLKTTFVKVSLDNLRIGRTYNIREMANLPLAVYNTGDAATDIEVEATVPIQGEGREGYEPIPDASWITFTQRAFEGVLPGALAMTDVLISVPDNPVYLGRRFQVMIWSHTTGGGLVACGLKSEVLFAVNPEPGEPERAITMLPTEIYLTGVEPGAAFSVRDAGSGVTLKIFNPLEEDRTVRLASVRIEDSPLALKDGHLGCPDPAFLKLEAETVTIPGRGQASVEIGVRFPDDPQYRGKRYMFAVALAEGDSVTPISYSAVCVAVKE